MGDVFGIGGATQAAAQVAVAGIQVAFASKQAKRARQREAKLKGEMAGVRNSRPDIINPYEGIEDLGGTFINLA